MLAMLLAIVFVGIPVFEVVSAAIEARRKR